MGRRLWAVSCSSHLGSEEVTEAASLPGKNQLPDIKPGGGQQPQHAGVTRSNIVWFLPKRRVPHGLEAGGSSICEHRNLPAPGPAELDVQPQTHLCLRGHLDLATRQLCVTFKDTQVLLSPFYTWENGGSERLHKPIIK